MLTYEDRKKRNALYLAMLEQRLQNNPQDREALLHKAILLYNSYQEPDQADSIFQSIIDQDPLYVDVYMWRAEFEQFFHADTEAAVASLQKALAIDPNRADCHALLAGMLADLTRVDHAAVEYHYRRSYELDPTFINPRFYFGQYLFDLGRFKEARHEFTEMLKHLSASGWPSSNPVEQYYEDLISGRNRSKEAKDSTLAYIQRIDAALAAAKIKPSGTWLKYGDIPLEEIKAAYDHYLATLEQRLQKDPEDRDALLHKAIILHGFYQEPDQSAAIFESIIDKDRLYVDVHMWRAACEIFFHGNIESAAAALQTVIRFVIKQADYYALLAWVLAALGKTNPEDVEYYYRKSISLDPTFINPRFYFGQHLFDHGRFEEARHEFNEMLQYLSPSGWPSSNPVEQYYEDLISGRNRGEEVKALALQYIQRIEAAQAAAKIEPSES